MKKSLNAAILVSVMPLVAVAGQVSTSNVTTFQSQTAARASEVNGNFSALIAAINDNASRIAALEAAATAGSVAGAEFKLFTVSPDLAVGDDASFSNLSAGSSQAVLSFGSSGSGTLNVTDDTFFEVNIPGHKLTDFSGEGVGLQNFTFVQNGNTVTLTFPDNGTVALTAAADGSLLVGVDKGLDLNATFGVNDDIPGQQAFVSLIIAIRQ